MKKKIVLLLSTPPPYGGGEIRNLYLKEYFEKIENYKIVDISRKGNNKSKQGQSSISSITHGLKIVIKVCLLVIFKRPSKLYLSIPKTFIPFLRSALIILTCTIFKVKTIADLPGMDCYFIQNPGIKKKIGLYVLKKITVIRLLGNSIKKNFEYKYNLKNTVVIDNGVYIPEIFLCREEKKLNKESLHLLFVGVLNQTKGVREIIESIPEIKEKYPFVKMVFVGEWGDTDLKDWAFDFIKKNQLEEYISFTGLIKGDDKWAYYKQADIYLHISTLDGQPISILEAFGMGLPIIASDTGAIPDTVIHKRNGFILNEINTKNIIEKIELLKSSEQLYSEFSKNNIIDFQTRFTKNAHCSSIEKLINTI